MVMSRARPPSETLAMIIRGISDFSASKLLMTAMRDPAGGAPESRERSVVGTHQTCVSGPAA